MKTEGGIYLDINESDYIFEFLDMTFYFSSELYLKKFKEGVEHYVNFEREKLKYRYGIHFLQINELKEYLAISFYLQIEKRGKKIICKNGVNPFEVIGG